MLIAQELIHLHQYYIDDLITCCNKEIKIQNTVGYILKDMKFPNLQQETGDYHAFLLFEFITSIEGR
jgi:hypothetical protein